MRRKSLMAAVVVAMALPLVQCGSSRHSSQERYFLVTANKRVPYWQAARAGLDKAASDMKVKVDFVGPDNYDPQAEKTAFLDALKAVPKPTGILVSAADAALMRDAIDTAVGEGVPVINIDSDSPDSKRLLFVGTNNYQAGVMAAREAVKHMNGKGNVVVFTMPEQTNLQDRLRGYKDVFADYPGIKITEIFDIKGEGSRAFDHANEIVSNPKNKVDAFVCLEALGGKEVADVLDRNHINGVTVMAFDTDDDTLKWIKKGRIAATVAQKPFTMGYVGLEMVDLVYHQKPNLNTNFRQDPFAPVPAFVDTGATLVDKNNVDQYIEARSSATSGR